MTEMDLLQELAGTRCRCGARKQPRQTFCVNCYFALPPDLRIALYRRIGRGYEGAYQAAVDHLASSGPTSAKPVERPVENH